MLARFSMQMLLAHLVFVLLSIGTVVVWCQTSAPLEYQPSTLNTALVSCDYQTLINATTSPFALCPPNTCHVVMEKNVPWLDADDGSVYLTNFSIGCCPTDTYGIYDITDNRLYGCCGARTDNVTLDVSPVPCFNFERQLIGCTNVASRCCGNQICGKHYVCCGGQCCPELDNSGTYSLEATCETITVEDIFDNEITYYSGCKKTPLFTCEPLITYNVTCPLPIAWTAENTCPYCPYNVSGCTFPPPNSTYLQLPCGDASDCVANNAIILNCTTITSPCTDGVSYVDIPAGCSNNTHTPSNVCIYGTGNSLSVLIGDRAPDETCCGPFICSTGMRCCSQNITTFQESTGTNITTIEYYGCCPDSPDIQCCYNNIMDPADPRQNYNFFCGAAFNSTACRVDKLRPALYFAMAQLAHNYNIT